MLSIVILTVVCALCAMFIGLLANVSKSGFVLAPSVRPSG